MVPKSAERARNTTTQNKNHNMAELGPDGLRPNYPRLLFPLSKLHLPAAWAPVMRKGSHHIRSIPSATLPLSTEYR